MADMITGDPRNRPLEPVITLTMSEQPEHNNFSRYLSFMDPDRNWKRLKVAFKRQSGLVWESDSFPNGLGVLESLVDMGNRSHWDRIFLENRGGSTTLPIARVKIVMRYDNPAGTSPHRSDHVVDGLALNQIDHAEIPIVDWQIGMSLMSGYDRIDLSEFRKRSLHKWAGLKDSDPPFVRRAIEDLGKTGSDGVDHYGDNPKYGPRIDLLCSEFVTWYYHENNESVNGQSLRDIVGAQQLHNLFEAEGTLYRYNSGTNLQAFVRAGSSTQYTPAPGDYLERRGPGGAEHSMMIYRWLPKDPGSSNARDRENQMLVINGPWPVTLRLVEIHKEETREPADADEERKWPKDYWLGKID